MLITRNLRVATDNGSGMLDWNTELKLFFEARQRELQFSDEFLAANFALCSRGAALRMLERFHRGLSVKTAYMRRLQELLCLGDDKLHAFWLSFRQKVCADRNYFFAHLQFFLELAEKIIAVPAYSNVNFYGMSAPVLAKRQDLPLTIGELLSRYSEDEWIIRNRDGHKSYVFALQRKGDNELYGDCFDAVAGRFFRKTLTYDRNGIWWSYLNYEPLHAYKRSCWTVRSLAFNFMSSAHNENSLPKDAVTPVIKCVQSNDFFQP